MGLGSVLLGDRRLACTRPADRARPQADVSHLARLERCLDSARARVRGRPARLAGTRSGGGVPRRLPDREEPVRGLFAYFAVPVELQKRALLFGIGGAIVLRAAFIFAGAAFLDAAHWALYAFGGFLVLTGIRMARHRATEIHPERNPVLRALGRIVPMSGDYEGQRLFVRRGGSRAATPLFAVLVLVATFDVVFAIDSIPAIFAVTRDTFIVFAANAFSLLGLTSLYFLLAGMMNRFAYLTVGLGAVLVFIGAKMLVSDVYKMPIWISLLVILVVLGGAIGLSLARRPRDVAVPGASAS
jgi:tellurite resistance protein TerC